MDPIELCFAESLRGIKHFQVFFGEFPPVNWKCQIPFSYHNKMERIKMDPIGLCFAESLRIGFFFTRFLLSFSLGSCSDFEKILGWSVTRFFKIEKILGFWMVGFFKNQKNTRLGILGFDNFIKKYSVWVYSVFRFFPKNTRLSFSRFLPFFYKYSVKDHQILPLFLKLLV